MKKRNQKHDRKKKVLRVLFYTLVIFVLIGLIVGKEKEKKETVSLTNFISMLENNRLKGVEKVTLYEDKQALEFTKNKKVYSVKLPKDYFSKNTEMIEEIGEKGIKFHVKDSVYKSVARIFSLLDVFITLLIFYLIYKFAFGSMNFELEEVKGEKVTFDDIAGYAHVKEELKEIVDFLKNPDDYAKYTNKLPKGVLLEGPPGNGKTLLAKALAGETETPFFQISGADIEDMFVGSGSRKLKKIFQTVRERAEEKGRAILFIDEIDAVGMKREQRTVVETNQTINKLLTELDGFDKETKILVMAATNLASSLDNALTRSGRFDRVITIPMPSLKERKEVLDLYLSKKKSVVETAVFEENYAHTIAQQTEGFCNADLDKLVNEAALISKKRNEAKIGISSLRAAFTKVVAGIRTENVLTEEEKEIVAYHEAAHAVLQIATSKMGYKGVAYITITPYNQSLGHVSPVRENRLLMKKSDLENEIKVLMAGRAIEEKILKGDYTTGAMSDLQKANKMLLGYLTKYGMSEEAENLYIENIDENNELVQKQLKTLRDKLYKETKKLVDHHYDAIEKVAKHLLNQESIDQNELPDILSGTSCSGEATNRTDA